MKNELQEYEKHKCNGGILRSKSKWALQSDRTTAYFLQLEKSRQNSKFISQIKNLEGNIVSETIDILDTVNDYNEQLFSCIQTEDESIHYILQFIHASVDENNVEMCDEDIR